MERENKWKNWSKITTSIANTSKRTNSLKRKSSQTETNLMTKYFSSSTKSNIYYSRSKRTSKLTKIIKNCKKKGKRMLNLSESLNWKLVTMKTWWAIIMTKKDQEQLCLLAQLSKERKIYCWKLWTTRISMIRSC